MDLATLKPRLCAAVPAVRLVSDRYLRRLLLDRADRGERGAFNTHQPVWVHSALEGPLLLLVEPDDRLPKALPDEAVLRYYWREMFRGVVRKHVADAHADRWAELGDAVRVEAEFVLQQDRLIPDNSTPAETYAAFAAEFLTRLKFAPHTRPHAFPSAELGPTLAVLKREVDPDRLLSATRPEGVMLPLRTGPEASVNGKPRQVDERLPVLADRAEAVRNDVRAAILRAQHASSLPSGSTKFRKAGREAISARMVPRLAAVLGWDEDTQQWWTDVLLDILDTAGERYWSPAAKGLYDLQQIAVDLEADIYDIDPAIWLRSFGRRSAVRKLALGRRSILLQLLLRARTHFAAATLPPEVWGELTGLLDHEIEAAEAALREQAGPIVLGVLDEVGLKPTNVPEVVARDKLAAELLDRMCEKGHVRLADLRDAIARNRLKLPDLSGPVEFFRGDPLLRADALLAERLDGIYHRGEVYLRWIQRGSAAAFGTRTGRFLSRFVALPFGGAVLTVEFAKYLAHEAKLVAGWVGGLVRDQAAPSPAEELTDAVHKTAHGHGHAPFFTAGSVTAMLIVGVLFLLLIHVPPVRAACWAAAKWLGRMLKGVLVTAPVAVWRSAPVRFLRNNVVTRVLADRFGWAIAVGTLVGTFLWLFGASWVRVGWWAGGSFAAVVLVLNTPPGRRWQDGFEEALSDTRRLILDGVFGHLIAFVSWVFRELLGAVDRWLYTLDEWFRFREGQSRPSLVLKVILAVLWFPVAYAVRFAFYLLIEPQVNPLKHFPVVTVSHKLLLPMIPSLHQSTGLSIELIGGVVWGIPGIFGFIVWELKENWRLYAANRPDRLTPVPVGHHGETVGGLLRPGFHSGTIPAAFRKLRAAERDGKARRVEKQLAALHHVEHSVRHFVERELIDLLEHAAAWQAVRLSCPRVELGVQRIEIEVSANGQGEAAKIEFTRRGDEISGRLVRSGFVEGLTDEQRAGWERAVGGLFAMAGVHPRPPRWGEWVAAWGGGPVTSARGR